MKETGSQLPRVIEGIIPQTRSVPGAGQGPALELDRRTYVRATDCVHCGLCLPACPTYTTNGLEADSPRGRIHLMKGLADGRISPVDSVLGHLDLCLDCRACETACPSGVVYHELIEETRIKLASAARRGIVDRLLGGMFFHVFPYPGRLKVFLLPVRLMQKAGLWRVLTHRLVTRWLPASLEKMQQMLPPDGPWWEGKLEHFYPAKAPDGRKRATVAFFAGCVGSVLFQEVNRQTIELLQWAGCDVFVPPKQECCGAIHHHGGKEKKAKGMAKANLKALLGQVVTKADFVVTSIAGCGAMLREYDHLLRDDPAWAGLAERFVKITRDISQVLVELNGPRPRKSLPLTVTYHDACHLRHAQGVADPPRQILGWIPELKVVALAESEMCCGAAGTYNLAQPGMARQLAERKLANIAATGAEVCVTGNVGCAMQIQSEARRLGMKLEVVHPVSLLHRACAGDF
ncbi:MAG: (Fe-S)-binding protein [Phycisphaeraceae bacterium]|nr:(Fe-S)-binding protein [Phycisphaeraceae bacterium]